MKFLKTAFAILASVLLAGTQPVFAAGQFSAPVAQKECGCCACKKIDCCMAQSDSTPQPIPATLPVSQNALQLIAIVSSLLLPLPEIAPQPVASTSFSSLHVTAVPLYEWNCSYLI